MKLNKLFLIGGIAFMALGLNACSDDDDYSRGAQAPAGSVSAYFDQAVSGTLEVDPDQVSSTSFDIQLARLDSTEEKTVKLQVVVNDSDVFQVPESVTFAANERTATATIVATNFKGGNSYNLTIGIEGDNPYVDGLQQVSYLLSALQWQPANGYYLDGSMDLFGGGGALVQLDYEIAKTSTGYRLRMLSPFTPYVEDSEDENGASIGHPFVEEGDVVNDSRQWVLNIDGEKASFISRAYMGIDFGYGEMYLWSLGDGTFKDNIVTLPARSIAIALPSQGAYYVSADTKFYLTKKAYEDEKKKEAEQ